MTPTSLSIVGVMPGLVPGIHAFLRSRTTSKAWMAGTSPAMTMPEQRFGTALLEI
jgi:hypothetical protein